MSQSFVQIDAFTNAPFEGNPAAVCLLSEPADDIWMQQVVGEMNLSETAFLFPQKEDYHLRWFTPTTEVELCGHATLASAYFLFTENHVAPDKTISFNTRSGKLTAKKKEDWIQLDFPRSTLEAIPSNLLVTESLNTAIKSTFRANAKLLVEVESEDVLRNLKPDFTKLKQLNERGLIATAKSDDSAFDFVSRYFTPSCGIDEDPVTGSAHCALGPILAKASWQRKVYRPPNIETRWGYQSRSDR